MKKRRPDSNIIERKLEQLPLADVDHLWNDMHMILDEKMPQKKERRRVIGWLASREGLLLLNVLFFIAASTLFFLSTRQRATIANKNTPDPSASNKFIKGDVAKTSRENKTTVTPLNETDQIATDNPVSSINSSGAVEYLINNNPIRKQKIKQPGKYEVDDQFDQSKEVVVGANSDFDIAPVNLKSIPKDLLTTSNDNKEKDSLSQQPEPVINKAKNNRNNKASGFYTGIIAAVDLSSVHLQTAKTGGSMGLIVGYAFNKKWSIESGLLWDTKRMYDNGDYFNPPGYTPTSGIKIIAVNGKSSLYEWPVNVKYTIISGKHSLFTTAGLSSYFMKTENYDYEYVQNNQPGGHNYLSYKNETKNWFSVANFSVGYTHKIGDAGRIRIEPYLKLPLKDLGTANMPIMSTGLNIGFTKTLR